MWNALRVLANATNVPRQWSDCLSNQRVSTPGMAFAALQQQNLQLLTAEVYGYTARRNRPWRVHVRAAVHAFVLW